MSDDLRLGIQYNWRDGESYPLKAKLQKAASNRIEIDDHHVTINFPDHQPPGGQNRKLLGRILPEALPVSDYSNVYLRLPVPKAGAPLLVAAGKINVPAVTNTTDFLANFTEADKNLFSAIRGDERYGYYNELFREVARVAKATGMLHTLEFELERKEDWDTVEDMVFVSCMLEEI